MIVVALVLAVVVAFDVAAVVGFAWLRGHDHEHAWRLELTPTRLYLSCDECGVESPGWNLFGVPPGCEREMRTR